MRTLTTAEVTKINKELALAKIGIRAKNREHINNIEKILRNKK